MARQPKDDYVPRAYLRGFVAEYLDGKKGGVLFQYYPLLKSVARLSINDYVACEADFYASHPIDKHWSQTIEQRWPAVRDRLKDRQDDPAVLDELFWFASAQIIRTPAFMNNIARQITAKRATVRTIKSADGTTFTGKLFDMVPTADVMHVIAELWQHSRRIFEHHYAWTLYHNSHERRFLTSDNPCRWNPIPNEITMRVALDMVLVGRVVEEGNPPRFHHSKADDDRVAKVNRGTVQDCVSWIYAHENTPELLRFVVKNFPRPTVGPSLFSRKPTGRQFTSRPR